LPMLEDRDSSVSEEADKRNTRPKRSQNKIISEILEVCLEGANKTRIVYKVNLNFRTVNSYLDLLIKNALIEVIAGPKKVYKATEKGRELLNNYERVKDEISWF
jgi:predicted transcriptional regulator